MPIGRLLRGPAGVDPTFITFVNAYMYVCIRSLSVGLLSLMFVCAVGLMCVHGPMVACINIGRYVCIRGLRVQHFCYPTRTRSTGPLPVPVPDPYSKLLPDPTRTRGYTRTRRCQAFLCIGHVPARLIGFQLGMYIV